jgi:hypothetical protein
MEIGRALLLRRSFSHRHGRLRRAGNGRRADPAGVPVMNAPLKALIGMLDDTRFAHIERRHAKFLQRMRETAEVRHAAVMAEAGKIKAEWRALPEEEKERRRMYWDGGVLSKKKDDLQFDADRDREEQGLTPIQYYWENK